MTSTIDMDAVADLLNVAGVAAYVEQTGGGCATIYAGPTHTDEHGDERYAVVAGPGWFDGPAWTCARAAVGDFYIGPDDDGENVDAVTVATTADPASIVRLITAQLAR